jgi:hypothetical protein
MVFDNVVNSIKIAVLTLWWLLGVIAQMIIAAVVIIFAGIPYLVFVATKKPAIAAMTFVILLAIGLLLFKR